MSRVKDWLLWNQQYMEEHPNEIVYAHTLLKAMMAVYADAEDVRGSEGVRANTKPPRKLAQPNSKESDI